MLRRHGAGDLEHPHEIAPVALAVPQVVQRRLGIEAERGPDAIRDQRVEPGALIHFVEVRQRPALIKHAPVRRSRDRRTIHIIEQPFCKIGRRREVFQSLLVLDADHIASEFIGDPQRGDIHLALLENLIVGEIGFRRGAGEEAQPFPFDPLPYGCRLGVRHVAHLGVQRRLAEPLLEHAGPVQQLIRDDGVEHPHAALVEDPHDGLIAMQVGGKLRAQLFRARRDSERAQRTDMAGIVREQLSTEPAPQSAQEKFIAKIDAPQRAVLDARLGERPVEVEQSDQPRPLAAPVRHRQDRPTMRVESVQKMVAVLPDRLDHNQGTTGQLRSDR